MCQCKPSILVVDDNPFNLEMQSNIIEMVLNTKLNSSNSEEQIQQANDGTVAVELIKKCLQKPCKCKNRVFRLIVMDMQMQKMHGHEASKIINKLIHEENLHRKRQ